MRIPLAVLLLALAPACRAPFGKIDRENALAHLDQAEADLRAGNARRSLEHLAAIHDVTGLEPDQRQREQALVDEAARRRFEELADGDPDELEDLFSSELPDRVRARAGVLAAQRMLERDERISAYRMVKKLDEALPGHPERVLAGDVVARAGLSLIHDDRRYNLLFHYRPRGVQALEYLVVNYPLDPHCPEAYFALSETYESTGDLEQAIERTSDLLLYHPESVYAIGASARLPYLRLRRLQRDDYDRGELLRADAEIASWLQKNPRHELVPWVTDLQRECRQRLVRNDLYLARFYSRTGTPAGQRLHAERARGLALEAGFAEEAEQAERLLADLGDRAPSPSAAKPMEPPSSPPAEDRP